MIHIPKRIDSSQAIRITNCRICNSEVKQFLNLGKTHPPEEFRRRDQRRMAIKEFPLGLSYCSVCGQVQLSYEIPPDVMYKDNFFYDYSITKTADQHFGELANTIKKRYGISKNDLVVDIGSNTGKLLSVFKDLGARTLGIDPATRLVRIARKNGIKTINSYFDERSAARIVKECGKARILTCNNVFDHVTNLHKFLNGVEILLGDKGIFVIEDPYFLTFFQKLNHVVYHQQLDYLLVKPFKLLFELHGLEIVNCEKIEYHGGSIRLFVSRKGAYPPKSSVNAFIKEEDREIFKNEAKSLKSWASKILTQRKKLQTMVKDLKRNSKSLAGVGMSAKGNCLLYYSGLGPRDIDFITEQSALKVGRFTPSGIPIVKETELVLRQPDYAILLAWNFKGEIYSKMSGYQGKFILPIPMAKILKKK